MQDALITGLGYCVVKGIAMEVIAQVVSSSPEEAAFRRYYKSVLMCVNNSMQFAECLLQEGVIKDETKSRITSNKDEDQKRLLLDSVQQVLSQCDNKNEVLLKIKSAMENSSGNTVPFNWMDEYIVGEYLKKACVK